MTWSASSIQTHAPQGIDVFELDAQGRVIIQTVRGRRDPLRAAVVLWGGWWLLLAVFFSAGTYINSYYVAALVPAVAALCGTGVAGCGPGPWPARVRMIVAATVLACAGYGAYLMSGTASGPVVLTVVALVVAAAAAAQVLLPASGKAGHLTAVAFAGAAVLLLPAAASVNSATGGLGPFDTPFESSRTAHDSQLLAASAPALTRAVQRLELQTPPGDALFGADTSALAQNYILYSGREVLPIGGFLGNVPVPALTTLQADISRGYVRAFVLPVSPPGPDPRCGGSSCTAPGSPRPRTAARSHTPASSAGDRHRRAGRLLQRPKHPPHDAAVPAVSGLPGLADPYHRLERAASSGANAASRFQRRFSAVLNSGHRDRDQPEPEMARPCGYHGGSTGVAALQQVLGQGDAGLVYVIESFLARIATVVNGKPAVSACCLWNGIGI